MRIALFSSFSPESGASSVPLRDHLEQMPGLDVHWYYLAHQAVNRAKSTWLGEPLTGLQVAADLAAGAGILPGSLARACRIVDQFQGDLFWIIGHYEGVCVAAELLKRHKPFHLTVHDHPVCMFRRSRKYRPLLPLMAYQFSKVIKGAKSVDVISSNLRDLYRREYDVDSFRVYRYVPELPNLTETARNGTMLIGHIGSVYHPEPFRVFLRACQSYAAEKKRALKIVRIGSSPELDAVAAENPELFERRGELAEREAIPALASCDFVYAMYPDGRRFECFRRTSMPMKVSTYIQAQRPIFAHTPADSGLAEVVNKSRVGVVCSSNRVAEIRKSIEELANAKIARADFEGLRQQLLGREQIDQLESALSEAAFRER